MKTKKISKFVILSLIIVFGMTLSVEIATAQAPMSDNVDDPQDDVVIINFDARTCEDTSLHPELDIDSMVRSGQTFTITLHELFSSIPLANGYLYFLTIRDGSDSYSVTYNDTVDIVILSNDDGVIWNGSGWGGRQWSGVGYFSYFDGKVLNVEIPTAALTITSSMEWTFATYYTDPNTQDRYMDITPNSHLVSVCDMPPGSDGDSDGDSGGDGGDGSSIPGYELTILISVIGIFTIGIIYIHTKKNRFK